MTLGAYTWRGLFLEFLFSPINQFIKGSTSGLVMNSYLNDDLENRQCYFSLDSFSTKRNLNLG